MEVDVGNEVEVDEIKDEVEVEDKDDVKVEV